VQQVPKLGQEQQFTPQDMDAIYKAMQRLDEWRRQRMMGVPPVTGYPTPTPAPPLFGGGGAGSAHSRQLLDKYGPYQQYIPSHLNPVERLRPDYYSGNYPTMVSTGEAAPEPPLRSETDSFWDIPFPNPQDPGIWAPGKQPRWNVDPGMPTTESDLWRRKLGNLFGPPPEQHRIYNQPEMQRAIEGINAVSGPMPTPFAPITGAVSGAGGGVGAIGGPTGAAAGYLGEGTPSLPSGDIFSPTPTPAPEFETVNYPTGQDFLNELYSVSPEQAGTYPEISMEELNQAYQPEGFQVAQSDVEPSPIPGAGFDPFIPGGVNVPTGEGANVAPDAFSQLLQEYLNDPSGYLASTGEVGYQDVAQPGAAPAEPPMTILGVPFETGPGEPFAEPTPIPGTAGAEEAGMPATEPDVLPATAAEEDVAPAQAATEIDWATPQTVPGAPGEPVPGGPQGPLYYTAPDGSVWDKFGNMIKAAGGAVAGAAGAAGRGIAGIPGALARGAAAFAGAFPTNAGGFGQPAGFFPGPAAPRIGEFGAPDPLGRFNPETGERSRGAPTGGTFANFGITAADIAASGVSPTYGNINRSSVPAPGGWGGLYGQGAQAAYEQVPFWQRMLMRQAHATAVRGYRSPLIGTGDAVARFAAMMGSHPRFQGAYSPAARVAALAFAPARIVGGGGQQGGGGGYSDTRGARGPGGRGMSPV
jgi:hypothetical protein